MFKPKPRTFRQTMLRALLAPVWLMATFATAYFVASLLPQTMTFAPPEAPAVVERPPAKGSPAWFIDKFDCWTGDAPADMQGKMPGHVVVTVGPRTMRGGDRLVGEALDMIFEGAESEITEVHAFCR